MAFRKYRNVSILQNVNVSSSGDYHFRVGFDVYKRECDQHLGRIGIGFTWGCSYQPDLPRMPQYLEREIYTAILALLRSGLAKFFEYDQDRKRRFDHLRYHSPDDLIWLINRTNAIVNRDKLQEKAFTILSHISPGNFDEIEAVELLIDRLEIDSLIARQLVNKYLETLLI